VQLAGAVIVQDPEKDKDMVKDLLMFKDRMDSIVTGPFSNDTSFAHSLQE